MKVLIHGTGTEGAAAAAYFGGKERFNTKLFDDHGAQRIAAETVDEEGAAEHLRGGLYLRSPGVPPSHRLVLQGVKSAALATTPTGYWLAEHAPPNTVTITGTKGKSTTTALLTELLRAAGKGAAAYGNIGHPVLSENAVTEPYPILEVSSYMMHDLPETDHFHMVTNLFKEHTDWHGSEAAYRAAKLKPFLRSQPASGWAPRSVIDDHQLPPSVQAIDDIVGVTDTEFQVGRARIDLGPDDLGFRHGPLRSSLRAALAAAVEFVEPSRLAPAASEVINTWRGLPSRQEVLPTQDGRLWVDDALATIPEATLSALQRFQNRAVTLIVGGNDRGQDFSRLSAWIEDHASVTAIGCGPAASRIAGLAETYDDFADAVTRAEAVTEKGGVLLFSPSAPSSAPYKNYKERSAVFRRKAGLAP
ncbi:MAG: UDP-N-acetylmuramoyl-L-alanine--D-glutamate ligase [Pseudomonadota bacterium]